MVVFERLFLDEQDEVKMLVWFGCLLVIEMDGNCVRLSVCVIPVNFSCEHIQAHTFI